MAASPANALPWATGATRSRRVLAASRRRSGSAYPLDASFAGTRSATAPPGAASSSARSPNATARAGRCANPGPCAGRPEQAPCERPLGPGELTQRLLLGRSGEAEERAPGTREPLDLPRRTGGGRGDAERAGQRERVDQGISLAHVAVQVRQRCDPGKVGFVLVRHEGEPQTQLGESYGGEFQIHAEE